MTEYIKEITLPSKGIIYGDRFPGGILKIRAMTTSDEKKMYASNKKTGVLSVISGCVVEPKDFDIQELITGDQMFLLIELRRHTYGDDFTFTVTCPKCKATQKVDFDLGLLEEVCDVLEDDFSLPIEVDLPISKKRVGITFLTGKDNERAKNLALRQTNKWGGSAKESEYIIKMALMIKKIDGEEVDLTKAREFLKNLHSRDSAVLWGALDKHNVGYDTSYEFDCNSCEHFEISELPFGADFFRPRY